MAELFPEIVAQAHARAPLRRVLSWAREALDLPRELPRDRAAAKADGYSVAAKRVLVGGDRRRLIQEEEEWST